MHMRVSVATDVAMIGIWDASLPPAAAVGIDSKSLEREAAEGHLFLIHTGADCGGEVDVFVDEDLPHDVLKRMRSVPGEFLLSAPSGRLTVGGGEDYGRAEPHTLSDDSTITVPSGDYRLSCYAFKRDEDEASGASIPEAEARVLAPEDLAYYRRLNRSEMKARFSGCLIFLLFPILVYPLGWKIALLGTFALALPSSHLIDRWVKRHIQSDARWERLNKMVGRAVRQHESPLLILALRRLTDRGALKGGSVEVE
jgi:hypothetical protein